MNIREAVERAVALNASMSHEQHALVEPYYGDIEAYGRVLLLAFESKDEDMVIGGFQTFFLYAYLRGKADANKWQADRINEECGPL